MVRLKLQLFAKSVDEIANLEIESSVLNKENEKLNERGLL